MTGPTRARFDRAGFHTTLDTTRTELGLTWRQVARQAGVSASTLTRLAQGKAPDVDTLARLLDWAGLPAGAFIRRRNRPVRERPSFPDALARFCRDDSGLDTRTAAAVERAALTMYEALREPAIRPGHRKPPPGNTEEPEA